MSEDKLWTTAELAAERGVTTVRVRELCNAGRFAGAKRYGGKERGIWLIPDDAAREWLASSREPGRPRKGAEPEPEQVQTLDDEDIF